MREDKRELADSRPPRNRGHVGYRRWDIRGGVGACPIPTLGYRGVGWGHLGNLDPLFLMWCSLGQESYLPILNYPVQVISLRGLRIKGTPMAPDLGIGQTF